MPEPVNTLVGAAGGMGEHSLARPSDGGLSSVRRVPPPAGRWVVSRGPRRRGRRR